MNYQVLYQWQEEIANKLPCLNSWQVANVALFSLGIIRAEGCQQQQVARQVVAGEQTESCARRWRRFLANDRVPLPAFFTQWSRWLVSQLGEKTVYLLVDETKLQDRLGALVVGVAWQGRCIPLAWRCYVADEKAAYPPEGQVAVIDTLLGQVQPALADRDKVVVLADRGIGNSSALCRAVLARGWSFLFRVTANSKIMLGPTKHKLVDLAPPGGQWSGAGLLFTSTGGLPGYAHVIWQADYDEPWLLVTNDATLTGWEYAVRNWQEQSFRDLKSGGWQWHRSRIRRPDHMARLLILLVLAYAWCLALGSVAVRQGRARQLVQQLTGPPRRHWSLFKEGLAFFFAYVQRHGLFVRLHFWPDLRFL